ncbi:MULTISPECIES: GNAT family N-acetyltransferase [unclassified Crossiella]|uniref:GNAT family N-acetyltransferase n=1 Tax=unclassified Crossiella TaxID=2620835 RepID=UPI001FFF9C91|nr:MULTISPECIES: GNAT family protein [unclassified Crossiella]MCK2240082.1 GNAT family N-acetyltransferase [Crossiella sp. S99.2]MCK2252791.1 GNAT family N-acetyltransferase [Crossiella sp. S99.1]
MVEIRGDVVRLREFRSDDLDDSMRIVGDPRVTRNLSFDPLSREQQEQRLIDAVKRSSATPRTEYYFAIATIDVDRLVGFARLGLNGVNAAKLGYAVAAEHWRKGYAYNACRSLIDFGFDKLNLHRISAAIGPENKASIKLVNKLGFSLEGEIRDHVHTNGAWRNSLLYSLLESDKRKIHVLS